MRFAKPGVQGDLEPFRFRQPRKSNGHGTAPCRGGDSRSGTGEESMSFASSTCSLARCVCCTTARLAMRVVRVQRTAAAYLRDGGCFQCRPPPPLGPG